MLTPGLSAAEIRGDRPADGVTFRDAGGGDLARINAVIAAAMGTWNLAQRVKRISLPLYQYQTQDLEHLRILVAESEESGIAGIAAIGAADSSECPGGIGSALLHGIYVDPRRHRSGTGSRLLEKMEGLACASGYRGMLVRAKSDAVSFFEARGYLRLAVVDAARDYPLRYWKGLQASAKKILPAALIHRMGTDVS